ncbi:MAG: hypothetical protein ACYCSH_15190, partial [Acidithiobacillus sp.]
VMCHDTMDTGFPLLPTDLSISNCWIPAFCNTLNGQSGMVKFYFVYMLAILYWLITNIWVLFTIHPIDSWLR